MNCEKFETAMSEELSSERDDVAIAALKQHLSGCALCSAKLERLRARPIVSNRSLAGRLVMLEEPILEPLGAALRVVSPHKDNQPSSAVFGRRFADVVSIAGSWAMRPETAMAALFLVMTGTSVLLLRGKSSRAPANAEITVTEEGSPAPTAPSNPTPAVALEPAAATGAPLVAPRSTERYPVPPAPAPQGRLSTPSDEPRAATKLPSPPAAPPNRSALAVHDVVGDPSASPVASSANAAGSTSPPVVVPTGEVAAPYASALSAYQAGRFDDARRAFDALAPGDPSAELWAARSVREERGCSPAVGRFDHVAQRATGTSPAWDALFEGARCRIALGDLAGARSRLEPLANIDAFRDRAEAELDRIARIQQSSQKP